MQKVLTAVLAFANDLSHACRGAKLSSTSSPANVGTPRWFAPAWLDGAAKHVVALGMGGGAAYFRAGCDVAAAPQATIAVPLASIDRLVTAIRDSERLGVPGLALSGPAGRRQGVRSQALYDAQRAVNRSRNRHLGAGKAPDGTPVTKVSFSPALQGLLILMVSYLRTSELAYTGKDYEQVAKAYLPLNVKQPFRLLFDDLTDQEKKVFHALYGSPRTNLFALANTGGTADASDGSKALFPDRVKAHQQTRFTPVPTWDEFIDKTVNNVALERTVSPVGTPKRGEALGCELLFAPLSRIIPYELGSRRVIVEMRRLGFNWVHANPGKVDGGSRPGWMTMATRIFDLARRLQ